MKQKKKRKKKKRRKELKSALFFKNIFYSAIKATLPVTTVESVIRKGTVVARAHEKLLNYTLTIRLEGPFLLWLQ